MNFKGGSIQNCNQYAHFSRLLSRLSLMPNIIQALKCESERSAISARGVQAVTPSDAIIFYASFYVCIFLCHPPPYSHHSFAISSFSHFQFFSYFLLLHPLLLFLAILSFFSLSLSFSLFLSLFFPHFLLYFFPLSFSIFSSFPSLFFLFLFSLCFFSSCFLFPFLSLVPPLNIFPIDL